MILGDQNKKNKKNQRVHIDLIESNDFTQKEYDDLKLLGVGKYSFGHCCN